MSQPKISVIIPIYNVERYLPTCLDSVIAQTFTDFEIICVNDGSPDNCGRILADYADRDARIKIITQNNRGLSIARNQGLKIARGSYIFFLDSDDFIHPKLLELTYTAAEKYQADMVSFHAIKLEPGSSFSWPKISMNRELKCTKNPLFYQRRWSRYQIHLNVWTKLFSKRLIQGLNFIPNITYEDYPFTYAVLMRHPKTVLLPEVLYGYRYNPDSISRTSFLPRHIQDYHTGLMDVLTRAQEASFWDSIFIKIRVCPMLLKQQYRRILKVSSQQEREALMRGFVKELKAVKTAGFLTFWGTRGLFFKYRYLINQKEEDG